MQPIDTNVANMAKYLKHALDFEKFVHVWSNSMHDVNQRMEKIYQTRRQLEQRKIEKTQAKATLSRSNDQSHLRLQQDAQRYEEKAKKNLRAFVIGIIVAFFFSFLFALVICIALGDMLVVSMYVAVPLLMIIPLLVSVVFLLVVCLAAYFSNRQKASKLKESAYRQGNTRAKERQLLILSEEETQIAQDLILLDENEAVLSVKQDQILTNLKTAQKTLSQIYALNVLPVKYRNICAVATMYEYLVTQRCNTISGHGGIYDTYETEKIQLAQLQQMVMMNERLSRIEDNQRYICQELRQANQSLSQIRSSLDDIKETNHEIARNTAITAEASRQTAANTSWLAYHAWANGY